MHEYISFIWTKVVRELKMKKGKGIERELTQKQNKAAKSRKNKDRNM